MRWTTVLVTLSCLILTGSSSPGTGATNLPPTGPAAIRFSGYTWRIKANDDSPGPFFSRSPRNVWVDSAGRLHLRIAKYGRRWYCAEVACDTSLGYGVYMFDLASPAGALDRNVVLGLFTWSDDPAFDHREIDIEISRWGRAGSANAQYVIQPWDVRGNRHRFNLDRNAVRSAHGFTWKDGDILFQSFLGQAKDRMNPKQLVQQWHCPGRYVPPPGGERVHFNLFLAANRPPSNGKEAEVVIAAFRHRKP